MLPKGKQTQFICVDPTQSQSERELTLSRIRRHAARVSYRPPGSKNFSRRLTDAARHSTSHSAAAGGRARAPSEDGAQPVGDTIFNPWQLSTGYRHDPFACFPDSARHSARAAIDFLTAYSCPVSSMINYPFGVLSIWSRYLLPAMSQCEDFFHAIAATLTVARIYMAESDAREKHEDVYYHRINAISKLRRRLSQADAMADDSAVLTMLFLGFLDKGLGDTVAQNIHLNQALTLVGLRSGASGFSTESGLKALLTQFEELSANRLGDFGGQYLIEPATSTHLTPSPFERIALSHELQLLPKGFQQLALSGLLSDATCTVVYRLWRQHLRNVSVPVFTAEGPEFSGFSHACPALLSKTVSLLERLVALALLRHSANMVSRIRDAICPYEDLSLTLTTKLPGVGIPLGELERETLLWVWLVAIDSWTIGTRPVMLASRGMDLLTMVLDKFPETRWWRPEDFERLGKRYLWRDMTYTWLRPAWQKLSPDIQAKQHDLTSSSLPPISQGRSSATTAVPILTHGSARATCESLSPTENPDVVPPGPSTLSQGATIIQSQPITRPSTVPRLPPLTQPIPYRSIRPTPLRPQVLQASTSAPAPSLDNLNRRFGGFSVADKLHDISLQGTLLVQDDDPMLSTGQGLLRSNVSRAAWKEIKYSAIPV